MTYRSDATGRTTYRHKETRRSRVPRTVRSFIPTGSGDSSQSLTLGGNTSALRIIASPDPATGVDRDAFSIRLLSSEIPVGLEDRAVEFNGTFGNDFRKTSLDYRPSDTSGSISFWVKFKDDGDNFVFHKSDSSTANLLGFYSSVTASVQYFHVIHRISSGTINEVRTSSEVDSDGWHHIVVTSSGSAWKIYVDGVDQSLTVVFGSNNGDWFSDFTGTRIGIGIRWNTPLAGKEIIDEVGVSSSILTQDTITYLYNNGLGRLYEESRSIPGLQNYWSLSKNHVGIGQDRFDKDNLTNVGALSEAGGILRATAGSDRAVRFFGVGGEKLIGSYDLGNETGAEEEDGSISIWIYPKDPGSNSQGIFNKNNGTDSLDIYIDNLERVVVYSNISAAIDTVRGDSVLTGNAWNHVVITSSGSAWAIYVNNTLQTLTITAGSNSGDWFADITGGTPAIEFGRNENAVTTPLTGRLDETSIWSSVLSADNVSSLYNSGTGVLFSEARLVTTGLLNYWSFSQNHIDIGSDRFGKGNLVRVGRAYDEEGILAGQQAFPRLEQVVIGLFNGAGFVDLRDQQSVSILRMDKDGISFKQGGLISEASDGEIKVALVGSDPDFKVTTNFQEVLFYDDSATTLRILNSITASNALGGLFTFESGSTIQEQADGAMSITAMGSDPDILIGSNTTPAAIFYDDSLGFVQFLGSVKVNAALGGLFTFESGSTIQEQADGAMSITAMGSDPDILIGSNTTPAAIFYDDSLGFVQFLGSVKVNAALGGLFTFESGSTIQEQADGAMSITAMGSDPDLLLETNTYPTAFLFDQSAPAFKLGSASEAIRVQIGVTAPIGKIHIDQGNTTAAIPVLVLDQADVSEPFTRLIGTSAVNTVTQTLVDNAAVNTATVSAYARMFIEDESGGITNAAYYFPLYTLT